MKKLLCLTASTLLLGACATTDNPREGGFFGGVQGINSGAYDKRIQEREDSLQRLNAIKQELGTEQARLSSDRQRKQARLDGLQQQLSQLDRETAQLSRQLDQKRSQLAGDREKTAKLKQDLAQLRQDIARVESKRTSGRPVPELEAERDRLEQEYRQLLDLYLELGQ
jgi:chromosome segregation ATPase